MRDRRQVNELISGLRDAAVPDVKRVYEVLRDDLAASLADIAADILLHQERCAEGLDGLPDAVFDDPSLEEATRSYEPPFWSLLVEDFQRLASWLPRQRLARLGEQDAVRMFRDRLVASLRPALVELQSYRVLRDGAAILSEDYWDAETLYDLAVRYEGFTLALARAIHGRMRNDTQSLDRLRDQTAATAAE